MVWKLDRLARSMHQLIETVAEVQYTGIELRSLTESIDTATPVARPVFHIFADAEQALWNAWSWLLVNATRYLG